MASHDMSPRAVVIVNMSSDRHDRGGCELARVHSPLCSCHATPSRHRPLTSQKSIGLRNLDAVAGGRESGETVHDFAFVLASLRGQSLARHPLLTGPALYHAAERRADRYRNYRRREVASDSAIGGHACRNRGVARRSSPRELARDRPLENQVA